MQRSVYRWMILTLAVGAGSACSGEGPRDRGATAQERAAVPATATAPERGGAGATGAVAEEAGVVYVDVRTPQEYAAGHVEGAIHIPHTQMATRWRELEPYSDERIVLYCRTGRRSGIALDVLRDRGFENVENGGGLGTLQRQGVPVRR